MAVGCWMANLFMLVGCRACSKNPADIRPGTPPLDFIAERRKASRPNSICTRIHTGHSWTIVETKERRALTLHSMAPPSKVTVLGDPMHREGMKFLEIGLRFSWLYLLATCTAKVYLISRYTPLTCMHDARALTSRRPCVRLLCANCSM